MHDVDEAGSGWMSEVVQRNVAHQFYLTRMTPAEVASAMFRRVRSKGLLLRDAEDARAEGFDVENPNDHL